MLISTKINIWDWNNRFLLFLFPNQHSILCRLAVCGNMKCDSNNCNYFKIIMKLFSFCCNLYKSCNIYIKILIKNHNVAWLLICNIFDTRHIYLILSATSCELGFKTLDAMYIYTILIFRFLYMHGGLEFLERWKEQKSLRNSDLVLISIIKLSLHETFKPSKSEPMNNKNIKYWFVPCEKLEALVET